MARPQKVGILTVICTVALVLMVVSFVVSTPDSDVSITYSNNSASPAGPVAILRLSNSGNATVRINAYCSLYWTNHQGLETNIFFRHNQGYAILKPHESKDIFIPHPSDAELWKMSFTYQVRPNAIKHIFERIRFWLPGEWVPDNSFIGRFSPLIRNPLSVAKKSTDTKE